MFKEDNNSERRSAGSERVPPPPPFFPKCSDQTEEPQTRAEVAGWLALSAA